MFIGSLRQTVDPCRVQIWSSLWVRTPPVSRQTPVQLYAVLCRSPLARPRLMCFSGVSGFISAYVLSSGDWTAVAWVSLWNERSHGSGRPDTAPGPGEPSCVLYQQKHSASVRNRSKILPVHVYSKQFNNTVQGLFTRHIINYTGYNQKQDRSVDSANKYKLNKSNTRAYIYKYR